MGPAFSLGLVVILAGCLFVPTFIAAVVILRSGLRAFVLSATFSVGAVTAGLLSYALASGVLTRRHSDDVNSVLLTLFAVAGAVGGGVLAVYLLGKLSKFPPWRRY